MCPAIFIPTEHIAVQIGFLAGHPDLVVAGHQRKDIAFRGAVGLRPVLPSCTIPSVDAAAPDRNPDMPLRVVIQRRHTARILRQWRSALPPDLPSLAVIATKRD